MAADEEFSLENRNILLPYVRDQGDMNACYSYSSGEAVQALHATTYSVDPFELSTQQIVDHLPRIFDYENRRKRKDILGCYYSNHPDVLNYIWQEGLVKDEYYVKRLSRIEQDVLPIPDVTRYSIETFEFLFQIGMPLHLKKEYETEKTIEEINSIIREQPIIGATKIYRSFWYFEGEGVYMGPDANEQPKRILHSILIVGFGISNGVHYYKIKNSLGIRWGHQGFGKIRRELVYRLAYPIAPVERKVEPEKFAPPVTKIKNTKPPRSKRHRSTSKNFPSKTSGPTQFGAQGNRIGTEGVRRRLYPTQENIDDINEPKKRFKTNALWGSCFFYGKCKDCFVDGYGSDHYEEDIVDTDCEPDDSIEFEYDMEDEDKDGSTGENFSMYPPFRVPNSGVEIEEILEEGKPTDESDTSKRPKEKKNQSDVTDEIKYSILVKGNTDSPLLETDNEDEFAHKSVRSKRSDGIEDEDIHEEAQNEKARDIADDERKGLKRIVCVDTCKANDTCKNVL